MDLSQSDLCTRECGCPTSHVNHDVCTAAKARTQEQKANLAKWLLERNRFTFEKGCISPESLAEWAPFWSDADPDPYVALTVFKRSSYVAVRPSGIVEQLPPAPMTQSKDYNKTKQGGTERSYKQVQPELMARSDFQNYVKHYANVHGIGADEPILMVNIQTRIDPFQAVDLNGDGMISREEYETKTKRKDFDQVDLNKDGFISPEEYQLATDADPLSGQGIHRDGMQAVSVLVVTRENCAGANNIFYEDHAGTRKITSGVLDPGEAVHFQDLEMFHDVSSVRPIDPSKLMHRSVMVLLSRFQDPWWVQNVTDNYGSKGFKIIPGKGGLERLFDLLDTDGNGEVDRAEFLELGNMSKFCEGACLEEQFAKLDAPDGKLTKKAFISAMERTPIAAVNHEGEHFW